VKYCIPLKLEIPLEKTVIVFVVAVTNVLFLFKESPLKAVGIISFR
jgi:hypothetical protein